MTIKNWADAKIAIIGNGRSFSFIIDGEAFTISDNQANFKLVMDARERKDLQGLLEALKPITVVQRAASVLGNIRLEGDKVFAGGRELRGVIIDRIMEFKREGIDFKYLLNFLDRLQKNPSKTAVEELYLFLESSKTPMPITEDGCFLAYKKVKSNFKDIHSGTVDYSIGRVVEMPRNQVDDNRNNTCSAGLHFCSLDYLQSFGSSGDPIIIVKIDPADVVSIPSDYNNTKGRAWRMEVLGLHKKSQNTPAWNAGFAKTDDQRPTPVVKAAVAAQTSPSSPKYTYFPSREAARYDANTTGRTFKDFGYGSNTGYRWAVVN